MATKKQNKTTKNSANSRTHSPKNKTAKSAKQREDSSVQRRNMKSSNDKSQGREISRPYYEDEDFKPQIRAVDSYRRGGTDRYDDQEYYNSRSDARRSMHDEDYERDFEYESDEITDENTDERPNVRRSDYGSHDNRSGYRRNPNQDRDERDERDQSGRRYRQHRQDREDRSPNQDYFMNNDEWQKRQEGRFDEYDKRYSNRQPKHQRHDDWENEPRRNSRNDH